jgi:parvulin-like peptidyl-prolyl isomerase
MGYHIVLCEDRGPLYLHLRHIFFSLVPTEEDLKRAQDKAKRIKKEIEQGKMVIFEDMGDIPLRGLDPQLSSILDTLNVGTISSPISDGMNIYLLRIRERKEESLPSLSEIHEQIRQILYSRKFQEIYTSYINKVSRGYFIKTML